MPPMSQNSSKSQRVVLLSHFGCHFNQPDPVFHPSGHSHGLRSPSNSSILPSSWSRGSSIEALSLLAPIGFLPPRGRGEARGHPAAESGHCTLATPRDTLLPRLLSRAAKELLK